MSASTVKSLAATLKVENSGEYRRRSVLVKQSHLIKKNGKKHHAYEKEKAPYPQSYDRAVTDLDVVDHVFLTQARNSVSFVDFESGVPERCLDLGCGMGTWVMDASKEWPGCQFVGFDLVNIQPPLFIVDPALSRRVKWVHGNFLTNRLPFDDDEFDHIHIRSISRAVPENKWDYLFTEVSRVLRPGGTIEMIEEDIRFPTLPRWYTTALRARDRKGSKVTLPDGSVRRSAPPMSPPPTPPRLETTHDHALLESLYYSVFETRFINLQPTSILPAYFATYFRRVICSPAIKFPMPPLPTVPTYNVASSRRFSTATSNGSSSRRISHRQKSSFSSNSGSSQFSFEDDEEDFVQQRTPPTSDDEPRFSRLRDQAQLIRPYFASPADDTSAGSSSNAGMSLLPLSSLTESTGFTLAFQLHRMTNLVLACAESIWEVLSDRIRNREADLKQLGWDDDDLDAQHARERFELILERYHGDMQVRAALWQSLVMAQSPSWKLPKQGIMSKAEKTDEERVFKAVMEAQHNASNEDSQTPCRTLRIFVGCKA